MYNENVYVLFSHEGMKIIKNRVVEGEKKYSFMVEYAVASLIHCIHVYQNV